MKAKKRPRTGSFKKNKRYVTTGNHASPKRRTAPSEFLPGFDLTDSAAPQSDPTYSVESTFRRYGLEGEVVFLALAARCVQESNTKDNGFEFFQYERGLQVLDLVTHDRQIESLLAKVCGGSEAVGHLPVWYQYFVGRRFRESSGSSSPQNLWHDQWPIFCLLRRITLCDPTCGGGTFLSEVASALDGASWNSSVTM